MNLFVVSSCFVDDVCRFTLWQFFENFHTLWPSQSLLSDFHVVSLIDRGLWQVGMMPRMNSSMCDVILMRMISSMAKNNTFENRKLLFAFCLEQRRQILQLRREEYLEFSSLDVQLVFWLLLFPSAALLSFFSTFGHRKPILLVKSFLVLM